MDKGLRKFVDATFMHQLPTMQTLGYTVFRRNVMNATQEEFGVTVSSASTHFNHARLAALEVCPELVADFDRPENKKGGRKRKEVVVAEAIVLLLGYTPAVVDTTRDAGETGAQQVEFNVVKKSTGELVATGVCFEDAAAMVAKAKVDKKAALYYV